MPSRVDEEYMRRLEARGPMFGVQQSARVLQDMIRMLDLQVSREQPGLSDRERRIETARRLYFGDVGAQRLLDLAAKQP